MNIDNDVWVVRANVIMMLELQIAPSPDTVAEMFINAGLTQDDVVSLAFGVSWLHRLFMQLDAANRATEAVNMAEPSAIVVPFGKHKGKTVAELLAMDQPYADWIMSQGWVAERFAELHAAIVSWGAGTDDTPEHSFDRMDASFARAEWLLDEMIWHTERQGPRDEAAR